MTAPYRGPLLTVVPSLKANKFAILFSTPVNRKTIASLGGFSGLSLTSPPHHGHGSPVIRAKKVAAFCPANGEENARSSQMAR